MTFKGLVIQSNDTSYQGKNARVERNQLTCLDAEPIKLKNTVDVVLPREEFQKIKGDPLNQTLEFDVVDAEVFSNRMRFHARVKQSGAKVG